MFRPTSVVLKQLHQLADALHRDQLKEDQIYEDEAFESMKKNQNCVVINKSNETNNNQGKIRVFKDGSAWCAVLPGFVNLQESVAGFGDTAGEAVHALFSQLTIDKEKPASRPFKLDDPVRHKNLADKAYIIKYIHGNQVACVNVMTENMFCFNTGQLELIENPS
jgi:hypothetical protein